MELTKEYLLYQYEELGILEGNANVKIVRNSITGKIAVKKTMSMEQLPVYSFLRSQKSPCLTPGPRQSPRAPRAALRESPIPARTERRQHRCAWKQHLRLPGGKAPLSPLCPAAALRHRLQQRRRNPPRSPQLKQPRL